MNESILKILEPWEHKAFELIFHGETHYKNNTDYNKRMAYINFDNAIEVAISTFMYINTKPKGIRLYNIGDLEKAKNYFDKLKIYEDYLNIEKLPIIWSAEKINHFHGQRNNLYHGASLFTPDMSELNAIRQISFWVFSTLFNKKNINELLENYISESEKEFPEIPKEYVKPIISGIEQKHEMPLFIASILGRWNENSQGDNEIINEVMNGF